MLRPLVPQPYCLGNEDGKPHLAYYDNEFQLAFTLNEQTWPTVQVSHGGDAEPVCARFDVSVNWREITLRDFGSACKAWVNGYRSGLEDNDLALASGETLAQYNESKGLTADGLKEESVDEIDLLPFDVSENMANALRLIGGQCEIYTNGGRCFDEGTNRRRDAALLSQKWCDACIAERALDDYAQVLAEVRS